MGTNGVLTFFGWVQQLSILEVASLVLGLGLPDL